jgi:hypothetical protein
MRLEIMETITITLPTELAVRARSLAGSREQKLPEFIRSELYCVLAPPKHIRFGRQQKLSTNLRVLSDTEVMKIANLLMEKWQALQMHRLIHRAGLRELTVEERKILDTLLEIHNSVGMKRTQGIAEAMRRGLLPPINDSYWSGSPRQKLSPRKKK